MTEEVPAFLGGELIEELADPIPEVRDGSLGGLSMTTMPPGSSVVEKRGQDLNCEF